ncbi:hypothetical protein L1887_01049 [Cichorium endivia]|nr:hypothetical protein L1887_01049 [Cichorium endivia]
MLQPRTLVDTIKDLNSNELPLKDLINSSHSPTIQNDMLKISILLGSFRLVIHSPNPKLRAKERNWKKAKIVKKIVWPLSEGIYRFGIGVMKIRINTPRKRMGKLCLLEKEAMHETKDVDAWPLLGDEYEQASNIHVEILGESEANQIPVGKYFFYMAKNSSLLEEVLLNM